MATTENKKNIATMSVLAKLRNCPTSPRKMRLVANQIRNLDVNKALVLLKHSPKEASLRLEKLLLSGISNWQNKFNDENSDLFIKEIYVDSARMLKRMQPAPQGRAHRIRKRSNHVTILISKKENN
ncbi:MAG: 50S ribosomal protein L22 [Flavobacteriales bacterium]|nr:50S ribosomal protein L22 [Flavobacteriales bacterium]|tara:strand:+ start:17685 stop:18062 length:378 start_codon:yes stop_codon:yes gene_type:complete